ncbi:hypothetical protein BGAL_0111g00140 [Botrytis galanthina]|uniref:Uncharacterized protein n=1 Tax=Botrytis galanthina TaxID=278940 RepID=A0A4V4HV06_9HELO|nr:hypothetical protein BGAL_0111g00140 [Botrytis galanthina]
MVKVKVGKRSEEVHYSATWLIEKNKVHPSVEDFGFKEETLWKTSCAAGPTEEEEEAEAEAEAEDYHG